MDSSPEAALAGKDIYLQKPTSLTVEEGRHMADIVQRTGRILQLGSQQRSDLQWRLACELVRNGRIGAVKEILIGLPYDPAGGSVAQQPVPSVLDYDFWLGATPQVHYIEDRVHPQKADLTARYDRPGWLRCEQFGAGMITGWARTMWISRTGPWIWNTPVPRRSPHTRSSPRRAPGYGMSTGTTTCGCGIPMA
ncbi:MAG: hypothetical protein HC927_02195, partial [Deltaproteobacteria bacterium]|nr:hypothetical protein [Deltaproteobacteria bacterium]